MMMEEKIYIYIYTYVYIYIDIYIYIYIHIYGNVPKSPDPKGRPGSSQGTTPCTLNEMGYPPQHINLDAYLLLKCLDFILGRPQRHKVEAFYAQNAFLTFRLRLGRPQGNKLEHFHKN